MIDPSAVLGGTCDGEFASLRELFAAPFTSGEGLGASLAVNIDGKMVVDLWGGWIDEARTVPWTENTIACVFSITKTMTTLTALALVDRGELDLDANVARYWPEFAAHGKGEIKVRHLLSHTSGVPDGISRSILRTYTTGRNRRKCWRSRLPGRNPGRPPVTTR